MLRAPARKHSRTSPRGIGNFNVLKVPLATTLCTRLTFPAPIFLRRMYMISVPNFLSARHSVYCSACVAGPDETKIPDQPDLNRDSCRGRRRTSSVAMCESVDTGAIAAARGSRLQACAPDWELDKTRRCSPAVAGSAHGPYGMSP